MIYSAPRNPSRKNTTMLQEKHRIDGIGRIDHKRRHLVLGAAAGAAALPLSWLGTALPAGAAGNGSPTPTKGAATMSSNIVKTKDGVEIFYKTGAAARRSCSRTAGRFPRTTGTRR
jgi:hypothetical protein